MIIFIDSLVGIRAINERYIFNVVQSGKDISIGYFTGDKVSDVIHVKYIDEGAAVGAMREYFKACQNNNGAFYFKGV